MRHWIRLASPLLLLLALSAANATILDLTTVGASGYIGDAFFIQTAEGSGTGNIDPFLRLRAAHSERGVNSDGPYTMDELQGQWTHSALVREFGVTDLNGVTSIRFLLDINEADSQPLLSLDQLKIFVAPIATYNTLELLTTNATLVYDMGAGNKILLNYGLDPGSGESDMLAYLPYDNLFGPHENEYLYLFCEFGATGGEYESDDGFEEWADTGDPPLPAIVCCIGEECSIIHELDCEAMGGIPHPDWVDCGPPNPCALPPEAPCCLGEDCFVTTEQVCSDVSGMWHPEWVDCGPPNPCAPPPEAVCCVGQECFIMTQQACSDAGGTWYPDWTSCDPNPCPSSPTDSHSWGWIKSIYR